MKIYNTYTREKETFKPIEQNKVKMYVCGPTVYDYIHIGNARPVIFFDVVNRYFKDLGYEVNYVSNITDVDDKIINKAQAEGVSESDISEKYLTQYLVDCKALGILPVDSMPKVTETMVEIIAFIVDLITNGFAYESEGDVYFRVDKALAYGQLSGKKIDDLVVGARVEENMRKENPLDFTLWKQTNKGVTWDSPWGAGRPGWHTECVVMIDEAFKGQIDIHGGGADLQFPHHENEIAQSTCGRHHTLANYWMHVGRLALDGEKMSKSLGNVIKLNELLEQTDANVFRLFMLSTHYRQPISFSYEVLKTTKKEWEKVVQAYDALFVYLDLNDGFDGNLDVDTEEMDRMLEVKTVLDDFKKAMEDDFNTANGITAMYTLVKLANKFLRAKMCPAILLEILNAFEQMFNVLGFAHVKEIMTPEEKALYQDWNKARENKEFELADKLRMALQEKALI